MTAPELSPWDTVQIARNSQRPHTLDYVRSLTEDFVELRGDRRFGDDAAMVAGVGRFAGQTVAILGHQKGSNTKENLKHNFGSPHPEGFRKALRIMQHAAKFGFPLLCFIDTSGASPNLASEERGQAEAIAENLLVMADLPIPIVATVIGEGGSGGALAISIADRLLMLEYAVYSVASPEASAAILWRDGSQASEAAKAMRITAKDLAEFGIIDEVIAEPEGGAHLDPIATIANVRRALEQHLSEITGRSVATLLEQRYNKYRRIGVVHERQVAQALPQ